MSREQAMRDRIEARERAGYFSPTTVGALTEAMQHIRYLLAELKEAREENERLTLGFEQLRQSLTAIQPEYEALKEKLEAVEEFGRRHSLGLGTKLRRELDRTLRGGD